MKNLLLTSLTFAASVFINPASAAVALYVSELGPTHITLELSGTISGPTPTFNQNVLSLQAHDFFTVDPFVDPLPWIIQSRTLTKTVSDFDVQTNSDDVSLTFAGTTNAPLTGLGDHISFVFDQAFVSGVTTFSTSIPVAFSTTGVVAIDPDAILFGADLSLWWGSNGESPGPFGTLQSFNVIPAIPVPAAMWLFGSALFGLVALKRKKA